MCELQTKTHLWSLPSEFAKSQAVILPLFQQCEKFGSFLFDLITPLCRDTDASTVILLLIVQFFYVLLEKAHGKLINAQTGHCLDVVDGQRPVPRPCVDGAPSQAWRFSHHG